MRIGKTLGGEPVHINKTVNIYVDPSSLSRAQCPRSWWYTVRRGLLMKSKNSVFEFGHAVHSYADLCVKGMPPMEAMAKVQSVYHIAENEKDKLTALCISWRKPLNIILRADGTPAHEIYFEHLMHERVIDGTLYKVYACGTMDCLRISDRGELVLLDYKTTRYATPQYAIAKYESGVQFRFYSWFLWKFGHELIPLHYANLAREGRAYTVLYVGSLNSKPTPSWQYSHSFRYSQKDHEEFDALIYVLMRGLVDWYIAEDPPKVGWVNCSCDACDFVPFCANEEYDGSNLMEAQFMEREYKPREFSKPC